jgi:hypothetical protein
MPFIEYMLLAILGASPAAATEGKAPMRTLNADAVTQPSGGAEGNLDFNSGIALLGQDTGGSKGTATKPETGKKPLTHQRISARRHRRHHNKVIKDTATRNAAHKG